MPNATEKELLAYADVAAMLSASSKTVYRLARADPTFPRKVRLGTRVRFRRADVLAWVASAGRSDRAE